MPRPASSRPPTPFHQLAGDAESLPIGQTLKNLRAARCFTQQDLANDMGISASYLSLLESGKRRTTRKVLRGLAEYLKVPVGYFVIQAMQLRGLQARHQEVIHELRRDLVGPALERAFTKNPKKPKPAADAGSEAKEATT
jgi:transcriptional regulator with XRE-family HTH domain